MLTSKWTVDTSGLQGALDDHRKSELKRVARKAGRAAAVQAGEELQAEQGTPGSGLRRRGRPRRAAVLDRGEVPRTQGGLTPPKAGSPQVDVSADGLSATVSTQLHVGAATKGKGQGKRRYKNIREFLRARRTRRKIARAARDAIGR